ncbi:MAG: hypothetical protein PHI68_06690 [Candidatus Cloacimonetes bacterium]|jgi:uncharacterized protein YdbL (DUF1318 family)|nr:hypothetical protein [Candidatus Cloacimonadota bacterium]
MKKALILIALALLLVQAYALDITLKNGAKFQGILQSAADGMIIIIEGKVTITIPAAEIKIIMDKDKNRTQELLSKANSIPMIDKHFVQSDDYFVFEEPLVSQEWIYVYLAKMQVPPSLETKQQAQFLLMQGGEKKWMKHWTKSKLGTKAELKLGTKIIFFDMTNDEDVYRVPDNTQEARNGHWIMAKITDTSELFKGYVMVSGGLKVGLDSIRFLTD